MNTSLQTYECGTADHFSRRTLLKAAGLSGMSWLTPMADILAGEADTAKDKFKPARSVIVLWMAGGPSQLDTFDPHPVSKIAADTKAIESAVKGTFVNENLAQTAELMEDISIVRSVMSKEGDHERAIYNIKTGFRPVPGVLHPSLGSIICHELPNSKLDIPAHVSIMPGKFPSRGGYLGANFDPFQMGDPTNPVPDVKAFGTEDRQEQRMKSLSVVEKSFLKGRAGDFEGTRSLHGDTIKKAQNLMSSEQLTAFDISDVPKADREMFGDSSFGRGCLAAVQLVEAGVRCVEVTLNGWDSHADNTKLQGNKVKVLDPAFASLIKTLKGRGLFEDTIVLWGGEFGRTPKLNPIGGRDHWPHGFSVAMAGGGIKGGRVIGETDPEGEKKDPAHKVSVEDIHATIQDSFGIDYGRKLTTSSNRPMVLSKGYPIEELLL